MYSRKWCVYLFIYLNAVCVLVNCNRRFNNGRLFRVFNKQKQSVLQVNSIYITSTGIIRFFTKQIATEGFSTVFGQSTCAL